MTTWWRRFTISWIIASSSFGNLQTIHTTVSAFMRHYTIPGGEVVLYAQHKPFIFSYGVTQENGTPINAHTRFEIASITKVLTALAMAIMAQEGRVHMSDPVAYYLPDYAGCAIGRIPLLALLTHVAGLPSMPYGASRQQWLSHLYGWHPLTKHEMVWHYSNVGFGMAGFVLEAVTGLSYQNLLKHYVFSALNMQDALVLPTYHRWHFAAGHTPYGKITHTTAMLNWIPAAGSVAASGTDMLHLLKASLLLSNIPPAMADAMRLTQQPFYKIGNGYQGLGWEIHEKSTLDDSLHAHSATWTHTPGLSSWVMTKTGSVAGFRAYIMAWPAQEKGLVLLFNKAIPRQAMIHLGDDLLKMLD
jgi:CubicO group peptidase (beta-lactamase class C family)